MNGPVSQFILLWICLVAGVVLRATRRLHKETPSVLNGFIFYISLPALIILQFHDVQFNWQAIFPVLMAWILFVMSWGFFLFVRPVMRMDRKTLGSLILCGGLANTSFVGFPMIEAFYGKEGLKTAVLTDQLGSFLVVSTLGILVASFYSSGNVSVRNVFVRIFKFPPIYALAAGFMWRFFSIPDLLVDVLAKLAGTMTPLALVSVGFQVRLDWQKMRISAWPLGLGTIFKLVLAPFVMSLLYLGLFQLRGEPVQITLAESAMAPMITSAIVAAEYELNSELASLLVGFGILLSFFTVPMWVYILNILAS
jgi:predicted permease